MADYIFTMESRLTPEQLRVVSLVQQIARSRGMNIYLTGGAVRDILTGFPIRDLDFTVQGNPLEFRRELETAAGIVDMVDPTFFAIHAIFQGTRVEIGMARTEVFDKPGKLPSISPATINDDLRRRDFTFNAMALSLNDGSRGLLLDPFNGAADIEAKLIRILHSYAFLEDPSRLIRATRFATRFGFELEERTRARYDSAREGDYIHFLGSRAIGYEIEQIAHEENPIGIMRALETEGWLKVLCPKWTVAKADIPELAQLLKTRDTMSALNISVDAAPAVMHFLTTKLGESETSAMEKLVPHREFVAAWKRLESDARDLSKQLLSKEAALNSGAWKILSSAKPEALLYLDVTGRNKTVDEKIKKFFGQWREVQEKIPFAQMAELRITPQLAEYSSICQQAFMLLLDGRLRSEAEVTKFLAPFEPPLPPPPPAPVRRGRVSAKKAAAAVAKASAHAPATFAAEVVKAATEPPKPRAVTPKSVTIVNHAIPPKLAKPQATTKTVAKPKQPVKRPAKKVTIAKAPAKVIVKGKTAVKTVAKKAPTKASNTAKATRAAKKGARVAVKKSGPAVIVKAKQIQKKLKKKPKHR